MHVLIVTMYVLIIVLAIFFTPILRDALAERRRARDARRQAERVSRRLVRMA